MKKRVLSILLVIVMVVSLLPMTTFVAATVDCPDCKGTGRDLNCKGCFGKGCDFCDASGKCPYCHGSGECSKCGGVGGNMDCFCGGSGKCDACYSGDGKCIICYGSGKCPECKSCETCGGTGKVATPTTYTYTVTFPEGPEQVYIIGDTSSWLTFTPMTMTSNTTATITLDTPFTEYKYTAGADWSYVEKDAQGGEISNRTACANPDVVGSWAAVPTPTPQYKYTEYENWQIKYGNTWEWSGNLEKVEDGIYKMEIYWEGTGFNVKSDENPIKKDWYAPEELILGEEVIAPVNVDAYLRVIDDETLMIGIGVVPTLTYAITNGTAQDAKGSITVAKSAAENDTVTVTVNPNEGYQLKSLTVVPTAGGTAIETTQDQQDTAKYTFKMPAKAVTVTATFEAASTVTTWSALQDAINAATEPTTIRLAQDLTAPAEGSSYIDIPAGKNIILDLNGHTLDRGLSEKEAINEGNVIRAGKDVSLTVKNGTITGSNVTPDFNKGALRCQETKELNLIDVDFANCKNVTLFLYGVKSTNIDGCTFSDNTYGGGEVGGAAIDVGSSDIDSQRKEITIKGCLFKNNTLTGGSGSAIHLYVKNYGYDTTIINSTFTGNHAGSVKSEDDGGAICIYNGSLVLDGCTITGNTAAAEPLNNHCGGVSVAGKTASVTLKGKTVIAGNTCGGNAADLYFKNKETTVKLDGLAEGSKIGVLTAYDIEEGSSAVVATNAASAYAEYFFSDSADYYVNFNNNNTPEVASDDYLELKAPADGNYAINVIPSKNGAVTASAKEAAKDAPVTLTVTPADGYQLKADSLLVKYNDGEEKTCELAGTGNTYTFTMPAYPVTVTAEFEVHHSSGGGGSGRYVPVPEEDKNGTLPNFFVDVKPGDYFYDAVLWAVENGITNGVDALHFGPNIPITRAQVVTFLWRTVGCPMVNYYMNMSDVKSGEYYTEAVRWALSEGITKGTSDTTFSPDTICTRGQIVAFLARFAGVKDDQTGYVHGFTDVSAADYFNNAVAWAKDNRLTDGTSSTTFSPNNDCTRAQTVTFLYRWMVR